MSSVRFVLKEPNKNEETLIYMLFNYHNKRLKLSTGRKIHPKDWNNDPKVQRARKTLPYNTELNAILDKQEALIKACFNRLAVNDILPNNELLKKEYIREINPNGTEKDETTLNQYIHTFINDIENGKRLTDKHTKYKPNTIRTYRDFKNLFEQYQIDRRRRLNFNDITIDFYDDFINYFTSKGNSPNTIGRNIKNLKAIMRAARDEGLHNNVEIDRKKFKVIQIETEQIYLTENEIERLLKLELSYKPILEVARDVFLIGYYTAQRFSDFIRIRQNNKRTLTNGKIVIDLFQEKTGEKVTIPVHWELDDILKKYNYNTPKIHEQKLNERIKEIGKLAGINEPINLEEIKGGLKVQKTVPKYELIKTHTARRSGASNMYLAGILTLDIMKITGHKTEREFLKYIRVTKEETAEMLSNHKYFNRPKLKVVK